jgi:hypothetical protein
MRCVILIATAAFMASLCSTQEGAAQSSHSVNIPSGARVKIEGNKAQITNQNGLTGTYECSCSGGKGTCTVIQTGPTVNCSSTGGATCTGICTLEITTTGVAPPAAATRGGETSGGSGPKGPVMRAPAAPTRSQ